MTREERQKAIDALKISAPVIAVTQEEFNDYIQTLNQVMDWLEQEPCEDCISRQAVLDGLASIAKAKAKSDSQKALMGRVMFFTEQLPPVTPQPKWIPVSENPKEEGCYMTTLDYGEYGLSAGQRYYHGEDYGWSDVCVIAWMPLPTPYEPQGSEDK